MKILLYGFSSSLGGIEKYLISLIDTLSKFDFESHILFEDKLPSYINLIKKSPNIVFHIVTSRKVSFIKNYIDIYRLFKIHSFKLIHYNVNTLSYIFPLLIAKIFKTKLIVHSRNSSMNKSNPIKVILHYINKLILLFINIDYKLAVSETSGKWLFFKAFEVIYNGFDSSRFVYNSEFNTQLRKFYKISESVKIIGHIGTFTHAKNYPFILKSFFEFHKTFPNSLLVLVGDGPLKTTIQNQIDKSFKNVLFTGSVFSTIEYYSLFNCLIFPSHYEGLPNVVVEAQLTNLPILLSNKISKECIINDNLIETLTLKENFKIVTSKLDYLMSLNINRNKISIIPKHFQTDTSINRIMEIYESVR